MIRINFHLVIFMCISRETSMFLRLQIVIAASDACLVDHIGDKQTQGEKNGSYNISAES